MKIKTGNKTIAEKNQDPKKVSSTTLEKTTCVLSRQTSDGDGGDNDHDDCDSNDGGAQHVYFTECYQTDLYRCRASFPSLRQKKYFQAQKVLLLPLIRDLMVTEPFQMISNLVKS